MAFRIAFSIDFSLQRNTHHMLIIHTRNKLLEHFDVYFLLYGHTPKHNVSKRDRFNKFYPKWVEEIHVHFHGLIGEWLEIKTDFVLFVESFLSSSSPQWIRPTNSFFFFTKEMGNRLLLSFNLSPGSDNDITVLGISLKSMLLRCLYIFFD